MTNRDGNLEDGTANHGIGIKDYEKNRENLVSQIKGFASVKGLKIKKREKKDCTHFELYKRKGVRKKEVMLEVYLPYSIRQNPCTFDDVPIVDANTKEFSGLELIKRLALFYEGDITYSPAGKKDYTTINTKNLDLWRI